MKFDAEKKRSTQRGNEQDLSSNQEREEGSRMVDGCEEGKSMVSQEGAKKCVRRSYQSIPRHDIDIPVTRTPQKAKAQW